MENKRSKLYVGPICDYIFIAVKWPLAGRRYNVTRSQVTAVCCCI